MSDEQTWVEALNISPESLSEWSTQVPPDMPLLVWCMTNGHVNAEDYFAWACDHFGLAVLSPKFFTESFKAENLNAIRTDEKWSAWFFPIGEWDDVTFIACCEPPSAVPENGMYAYVLADPAAMQTAWGAEEGEKSVVMEAPHGITPNAASTFVLNLDEANLMKHNDAHDPNQKNHDEKTNVTLSMVMDKTGIKAKPQAAEPVKPAAKLEVAKPVAVKAEPPAPAKLDLKLDLKPAPAAAPKPPPAAAPAPSAKAPSAPPATPAAKPAPAAAKPAAEEATPPPAPAPRTRPGLISAATANEESEIASAFSRLHDYYQSAMIMRCVDGSARPYKWDPSLPLNATDDKYAVNLSYASFFRIVAKTLHPYHGYVIDSPAHKEFFANLNFENPPPCVTAIPLKAGDKLWGLLVAFGGQSAQTPDALNEALGVAEKLGMVMGATWAKSA